MIIMMPIIHFLHYHASTVYDETKVAALCLFLFIGQAKEDRKKSLGSLVNSEVNSDFLTSKKRILGAFIPVIILNKIKETTILSPTYFIDNFKMEYGFSLSPGTIYPIFLILEKEGKIRRLPCKTNRLYTLTSKGRESLEYFRANYAAFYNKLKTDVSK